MSATAGLARQADGLEKLLALASLNKADIAAAGEENRRQLQLTQVEEGKLAEARAYISKHEALEAAMQAREGALAIGNTQLELDKIQHTTHVISENKRLEEFSAKLDAKNKHSEEFAARLEKEKDIFAGLKIDQERQHRDTLAACQKQQTTNTAVAQGNAAEIERLKLWEATLKRKAELIRQQMADF